MLCNVLKSWRAVSTYTVSGKLAKKKRNFMHPSKQTQIHQHRENEYDLCREVVFVLWGHEETQWGLLAGLNYLY